jgi:hypothetical protein
MMESSQLKTCYNQVRQQGFPERGELPGTKGKSAP